MKEKLIPNDGLNTFHISEEALSDLTFLIFKNNRSPAYEILSLKLIGYLSKMQSKEKMRAGKPSYIRYRIPKPIKHYPT